MDMQLPASIRYIKNGPGGRWWESAKAHQQIHAGWDEVPDALLRAAALSEIKPLIENYWGTKPGGTQDFNALCALIDRPSRHVWITFEEGRMWWCTVRDEIQTAPADEAPNRGHFWLSCDSPWSDKPMNGGRQFFVSTLPGTVTAVAGFRGTVCEPKASAQILRIIRNEQDPDVRTAEVARQAYQDAVAKLVARLGPQDFEVLIDLIFSRTGWARLAKLGGVRADVDLEVENASLNEIAFVQVKSVGSQVTLDDYVSRFNAQRARYSRMIFAVHSPSGDLTPPVGEPVQIWTGLRIAELVVKHGLGDWVAKRL